MQHTSNPNKTKLFFKKHFKAILTISIVLILISIPIYLYSQYTHNLAKDVATPIKQSLVKAGAVKKYERDDPGHGPDNFQPWYDADFVAPKTDVISIIQKAAQENGYNLVEDFPDINRADNRFFVDTAKKSSPYAQLQEGKIDMQVTIYGEQGGGECTSEKGCDTIGKLSKDQVLFRLSINLPYYKQ